MTEVNSEIILVDNSYGKFYLPSSVPLQMSAEQVRFDVKYVPNRLIGKRVKITVEVLDDTDNIS